MAIEIPNQLVAQVTCTGNTNDPRTGPTYIVRGGAKVLPSPDGSENPDEGVLIWTPGLTFWNADGSYTGTATALVTTSAEEAGFAANLRYSKIVQKAVEVYNAANGTNVPWRECNLIRTWRTGVDVALILVDFFAQFFATPQTT